MRTIAILLLLASPASAGLIAAQMGNDNEEVVSKLVGHDVELIGKIEIGNPVTYEGKGSDFKVDFYPVADYEGLNYTYYLASLLNKDISLMSGSITQINGDYTPLYFVTKAGKGFNLWDWEDPAEWYTYNWCADLSHVSIYGHAPEPSSLCLMLIGLLFIWRRR